MWCFCFSFVLHWNLPCRFFANVACRVSAVVTQQGSQLWALMHEASSVRTPPPKLFCGGISHWHAGLARAKSRMQHVCKEPSHRQELDSTTPLLFSALPATLGIREVFVPPFKHVWQVHHANTCLPGAIVGVGLWGELSGFGCVWEQRWFEFTAELERVDLKKKKKSQ